MSQRSYRRLTRFLFFFLFLIFFLLYLLLRGQTGGMPRQNNRGINWIERHLSLGDVEVSEIRSGGFIVDEFPIPASTETGDADFEANVITVSTSVHNEGEVAVDVTPSIYGTQKEENANANPGLHCAFYHYGGTENPAAGGYAAFLAAPGWSTTAHSERALDLHIKDSAAFTLAPGETRHIVLFFWVDAQALPTVTDLHRQEYSVTVKLTSRSSV